MGKSSLTFFYKGCESILIAKTSIEEDNHFVLNNIKWKAPIKLVDTR